MLYFRPYDETLPGVNALVRVYPLPGGYKLCRWAPGTANRALRESTDRGTIWDPNGGIYKSGRNASDLAALVRLIRSGNA